jgi:hypothetical protein
MNQVVPFTDDDDPRSEAMFSARMAGRSLRSISKEFGVPSWEVERACLRYLPRIDEESIKQEHRQQLAYMLEIERVFYTKSIREEDVAAAGIAIRAGERVASMMGYDYAPMRRDNLRLNIVEQAPKSETSTQRMRAIIDRIVNERPAPVERNGTAPSPSKPDPQP